MKHWRRQMDTLGVVLALFALMIHWWAHPTWIEQWYGQGLFVGSRALLDHTIAFLPFAFFYVLLLALLGYVIVLVRDLRRQGWRKWPAWGKLLYRLGGLAGWVIFCFYLLWGFNYDRPALLSRLDWQPAEITEDEFLAEAEAILSGLGPYRLAHDVEVDPSWSQSDFRQIRREIREAALTIAGQYGYIDRSGLKCRELKPQGILLRLGTAGFYNPLSGECNVDVGLHTLQKPFVIAHEFFHGLGVTGEGDCNFLAYVLCARSDHPLIHYSGQLSYWRYLRRSFYRADEELYQRTWDAVPEQVKSDLASIDAQMQKFPDLAPRVRDAMYNAYLKSNKIHDGMANYNRIVSLVINWRKHEAPPGSAGEAR